MIHPTPTRTLLTTTFEPLVMQLSGLLARGTRLLDRFVHTEPTPETTMAFERELSDLLREVGRRIMAWTLNRLEPAADSEAPSRVLCEGRLYRRRRQHPHAVGTLFGPVTLWRRLYEPRGHRGRSMHPLELRLGIEAGLATPALAERVGSWATDHTQHEVLEIVQRDHGVSWSCTSLRKVLGSLRTGMAPICIKASYLPHNHGFRPREHPPYNTQSLQVIGDSFGVFFFVYTTLSGELA